MPRLNPPRRITKATSHSTLSIRTFWPLGKRAKRPVRSSLVSIRRSYQADQVRIFIKVRKLQCKPSPDALPNQERVKLPASKVSFTPERKLSPMLRKSNQAFTGRKSQKTQSKTLQVNFHHHCDSVGTMAHVTKQHSSPAPPPSPDSRPPISLLACRPSDV